MNAKMMTKKQQEKKKMMVRVLCIFLAFLMIASALFAVVELF